MRRTRSEDGLRTIDYVIVALDNLGGATRPIDIEDIAMEAYRLAPHRFRWRRYPEQVDIAGVRDGLSDARKPESGVLVAGDRKHGWTLTVNGLAAAKARSRYLPAAGEGPSRERVRVDVPVRAAERHRVMTSRALQKARSGAIDSVTTQDVRELLRIDPYVTEAKYAQRVSLVMNALADEPEVLEIVRDLESRHREAALKS